MRSASVPPGIQSYTMVGPSGSSARMRTSDGSSSWRASSASRMKRAKAALRSSLTARIFSATDSPVSSSTASITRPVAPEPASRTTR